MFNQIAEVIDFMKKNGVSSISIDGEKINVSYLENVFLKDKSEKNATPIAVDLDEKFSSRDYVTVSEAAELSGCCEATIISKIKKGFIAAERRKKKFLIHNDEITKFMESQVIPEGWKTIEEISKEFSYSCSYLSLLMKQYNVKSVRIGMKKYFDYNEFLKGRNDYETDVLINDGHRKGPVRFMNETKTK